MIRRFGSLQLRERQVLSLIAEGLTNRQIGERLGLAEKTVKNYVSGLLRKLGLERRTQAAVYVLERRDPTGTERDVPCDLGPTAAGGPGNPDRMFTKVIAGWDGTPESQAAVEWAAEHAGRHR